MIITKEFIRDKLLAYLNHHITLAELVDWAEESLCEADLDPAYTELLSDVLARIGLADVKAFGLSWESCVSLLSHLGHQPRVTTVAVRPDYAFTGV